MSPEALADVSSSLKKMVTKVEGGLRAVNQLSESWPVNSLEVWAPSVDGGPQNGSDYYDIEFPDEMVSGNADDTHQMAAG